MCTLTNECTAKDAFTSGNVGCLKKYFFNIVIGSTFVDVNINLPKSRFTKTKQLGLGRPTIILTQQNIVG